MAKPKPPTETDLLFEDSIRRALQIPPDEVRGIIERCAPGKPRRPKPTAPTPRKRKTT